ncbi:MAG: F0F1 ATP synthase subunit epsilon [Limnochordales bacterium]|nr:F0F1 ATP synthase subunit epsilon [Limnochordales bacterium]
MVTKAEADAAGGLLLEVITPGRTVLRQRVESVLLPALDGYLGIMSGHAPLVAGLAPGVLLYGPKGREKARMAVSGGLAEVAENHVRVLADAAELPEEIDVGRARAALERAEERLRRWDWQVDVARAEMAMRRALARLRAVYGKEARDEGAFAPGERHLGEQ